MRPSNATRQASRYSAGSPRRPRLRGRIAAALLPLALCGGAPALAPAARAQQAAPADAPRPALRDSLQGRRFRGALAVGDETLAQDEVLSFEDGEFSSRLCRRYGFGPAPYWVRRDAAGLHFRADLQSARSGTIRFEGVFDGERMRATARWTKERWYWTVEQTLRFTGRALGHER